MPVRRMLAAFLVLLGFGGLLLSPSFGSLQAQAPHADLMVIDGPIQPTTAKFLSRAVGVAVDDGAELLIIQLDTPGGLLSSTRDMVGELLGSAVPTVVYVYPPGARAASAGTFITAAAHVAAMAPGTNIGAASPVGSGGRELPETIKSKATKDAAALIRSIAEERGRNADALERTVFDADSFTASEALENGMVDLVADDVDDLLASLDGKTVSLVQGEVVLETSGLAINRIHRNPIERFLGFIGDPNVAFVLLTLGGIGIVIEFLHPGIIFPGLFGAIALTLAFLGLGNLPVNWVGVGLLGLAMMLFFFEMQASGIGVFGVGGAVSFVLGAFLLFGAFSAPPIPQPSFRISPWVMATASGALFAYLLVVFNFVVQARREPDEVPSSTPVGQLGTVTTALDPHGIVQVASERWSAVSDSGEEIAEGEKVIISEVEGLILKVFRSPDTTEL